MDVAVNTANWLVGQATSLVMDTVLQTWAANNGVGQNAEDLKTELFRVQATLQPILNRDPNNNKALEELLRRLRSHASDAENVLDELDYFRIQDELEHTAYAADEQSWRDATKAVAKRLIDQWAPGGSASKKARGVTINSSSSTPDTNDGIGSAGKPIPCSPQSVSVPDDGAHSGGQSAPQTAKLAEKTTPPRIFDRVSTSEKMKHITQKLRSMRDEVSKIINTTIGPSQNVAPSIVVSRPNTISESVEPRLYGRDQTKNSIIHDITQGKYRSKSLTVLPIVGLGGIGKTTLVQHIYQDPKVKKHFQVPIWTCVSSLNFDVDNLHKKILENIPEVNGEKQGPPHELIGHRLKSKTFLLVLDDMWECNEDEWGRFLLPFKKSKENGNIILVTTRIQGTAQITKTVDQPIELNGLDNEEEFRKLLLAFIFGDDEKSRNNYAFLFDEFGDEIVAKLKGSPLAAKTVGRLLRNRLNYRHWAQVLGRKEWALLEETNNEHGIMPALKLSYDYLSFHLKQCFLYCALFPEDHEFNREELIHFWIGLDILDPGPGDENKNVEDIGLARLDGLVSYGFLKKEETHWGTYKYLMHDLLHDLAVSVAAYECLVIDGSNNRRSTEKHIRHLSIIMGRRADKITDENFIISKLRTLDTILETKKLRTLMVFGESDQRFGDYFGDLIKKANGLRVLHLPQISSHMWPHVQSTYLPHLRYLRMWGNRRETHLPHLLSRFYHLRILNIYGLMKDFDFPRDMSNLRVLRHLLMDGYKNNSKICNVGKLIFLQELNRFEVNKESQLFELKQLGSLVELRELGIYNLEKIHTKEEAAEAEMLKKVYLQKLTLGWDTEASRNERDVQGVVLEALQPDKYLEELCITGHGSRSCPEWLGSKLSVKALQSLHLLDVGWEYLPWLGHMMTLRELRLTNMSRLTKVPSCFGTVKKRSFCNLNKLELHNLERLEKWDLGETCDRFPQLQVLKIRSCPQLQELPFVDNKIHWFPKLQVLQIHDCPKVALLPAIPWTTTLQNAVITGVESSLLDKLVYSKSEEYLKVKGNGKPCSIDEVLAISNLADLQSLRIHKFPVVDLKQLEILGSLKWLSIKSPHVFVLSKSDIVSCNNIKWFGVEVDQEKAPSQQEITQQTASEVEGNYREDGLLVLPAHLSGSLRKLTIHASPDLSLVVASPPPLHALRCLEELKIHNCPKFLSAYYPVSLSPPSAPSCPFPSSLKILSLIDMGMGTLEPLSNLTSLTQLSIQGCGEEDGLTGEGLWALLAHGQLSKLSVSRCPKLFVGCTRELQGEVLRRSPPKLCELRTDDITGFLAKPICDLLSSSLTMLELFENKEMERLTEIQEHALQLLTSLQVLQFWRFHRLRCLPAGLHTFASLKRLGISSCPAISSLSTDDLPVSLKELELNTSDSEELRQQCRSFFHGHPTINLTVYVDPWSMGGSSQ